MKTLPVSIAKRTLKVSNSTQSRTVAWGEFAFVFVGAKNKDTLKRIDDELTKHGKSAWTASDGVACELTAEDWWPRQ